MHLSLPLLQLKSVSIIFLHVLADPQDHRAQHNQRIRHYICNPKIHGLKLIFLDDILQHQHGHRARQPASHEREPEEEDVAGFVGYGGAASVIDTVAVEVRFFDGVDYEHPRSTTNPWNPVNEVDVYIAGVVDFAVDGGIDEEPESEGE